MKVKVDIKLIYKESIMIEATSPEEAIIKVQQKVRNNEIIVSKAKADECEISNSKSSLKVGLF